MSELGMHRDGISVAEEFDDAWFEQGSTRWRGRIIAGAVVAIIVAGAAFAVWNFAFRAEGEAATTEQIVEASLGTVSETIETSGSVTAQSQTSLNFMSSGKVAAVNAKLGQAVKKGDVLAKLDAPELADALRRAQITLLSAQLKLNELLEGADAAELAAADESYTRALAAYATAEKALADLRDAPTAAELNGAEQKLLDAESAVLQAEAARTTLDSTSDEARDVAESALAKAETSLSQAEQAADDANDALDVSVAQLEGAEAAYCPDAAVSFCGSRSVPLSPSDESKLRSVVSGGGDPVRAALASDVLNANTSYKQNLTAQDASLDAVESAQDAVDDAEAALAKAAEGPTANDIAIADKGVASAKLALAQAQADLADVKNGSDPAEIRAAESDLDSADASVRAAEAQRNDAYDGAEASEVADQRDAVELAQLSLDEAERNMEEAQLVAPFSGTVADLNIKVGDTASATGSESAAAIVLNTPDALVLELAINDSDLAKLKIGQKGTVSFDQFDGAGFPITIDAIGGNPTSTQGVTTYEAVATIDLSAPVTVFPGGGQLPQGFELPDGFTPPADVEVPGGSAPGVVITEGAEAGARPTPVPGMAGTVTITIEEQSNVIVVPSAAIQRDGLQQIVEIETEQGERQRIVVETGLSSGAQTAITAGLEVGEQVVVRSRGATTTGGFTGAGGAIPGDIIITGESSGGGSGGFFVGPAPGGGQ